MRQQWKTTAQQCQQPHTDKSLTRVTVCVLKCCCNVMTCALSGSSNMTGGKQARCVVDSEVIHKSYTSHSQLSARGYVQLPVTHATSLQGLVCTPRQSNTRALSFYLLVQSQMGERWTADRKKQGMLPGSALTSRGFPCSKQLRFDQQCQTVKRMPFTELLRT
jgi:hypothetical protein